MVGWPSTTASHETWPYGTYGDGQKPWGYFLQSCNERKQQKCLFNKANKGMKSFQNQKFVDDCDFSVWLFPVVAMSKMSDLVRGKVSKRFRTGIQNPKPSEPFYFVCYLVVWDGERDSCNNLAVMQHCFKVAQFQSCQFWLWSTLHPESSIFKSSLVLTKHFFSLHPIEFVGEILIFQAY